VSCQVQEFFIEKKSHIPEFLGDGIPESVDGLDIREYGHPHHSEYLRALIMELSLHSGGEYQIYLLCHVKDSPCHARISNAERGWYCFTPVARTGGSHDL
jgi:hypothetical protein